MKEEIEIYLEEKGFVENDWGFLTQTINGITYTLVNDVFSGFWLKYNYIRKRTAALSQIPLGRHPSIEQLQMAFKKVVA